MHKIKTPPPEGDGARLLLTGLPERCVHEAVPHCDFFGLDPEGLSDSSLGFLPDPVLVLDRVGRGLPVDNEDVVVAAGVQWSSGAVPEVGVAGTLVVGREHVMDDLDDRVAVFCVDGLRHGVVQQFDSGHGAILR